jgi:IS1 family transposase
MATYHSFTFSRDKGVIIIEDIATEKTYRFDINTATMYKPANKPMKSCPAGLGKFLNYNFGVGYVMRLFDHVRRNPYDYGIPVGQTLRDISMMREVADLFRVVDKINSLGAKIDSWQGFSAKCLREIDANFKYFAKYCRETEDPSIRDYFNRGGMPAFASHYNLDRYHLSEEDKVFMWQHKNEFEEAQIPVIAYHLSRGLREFLNTMTQSYLHNFFSLCDKLEIEPPKEDFYRTYINLKREYEVRKKEIDGRALERNYNKKRDALSFELGNYTVIIPSSADEFKDEANQQHNCVYSSYLGLVVEGETYVVFIRHKDALDKSVITCEIKNGEICQYLARYNQRTLDAELCEFRMAYQKHLTENW